MLPPPFSAGGLWLQRPYRLPPRAAKSELSPGALGMALSKSQAHDRSLTMINTLVIKSIRALPQEIVGFLPPHAVGVANH
jgi:hypothetical protein